MEKKNNLSFDSICEKSSRAIWFSYNGLAVNVLMSKRKRKEVLSFRLCSYFGTVSLTDAPSHLNPRTAMFNGILYEGISNVT